MPIRLLTSGGGTTTIQPTTSASSVTLTVPSVNANVVTTGDTASVTQAMLGSNVATTGPSFSAYNSSSITVTGGNAWTKMALQTEEWDTANCFDSTTNYRFTPNVAGYYQFSGSIQLTNNIVLCVSLYKNGGEYRRGCYTYPSTVNGSCVAGMIYLNGSTDYVELYAYNGSAGSVSSQTGAAYTFLTGFLARSA